MDFYINQMVARSDDALIALLVMIAVQIVAVYMMKIMGKMYAATPVIETAFRPLIMSLCDRLNRAGRSTFALMIRGLIVFFLVLTMVAGVAIGIDEVLTIFNLGQVSSVVFMALLLSPIAALWPMIAVSFPMTKEGNFRALSRMLNVNLITNDDHGLRRMAGKASVIALSSHLIGPLIYYIIAGQAGVILYVSLGLFIRIAATENALFISVPNVFYRMMQWPVNGITAMFIVVASCFSAGGRPLMALVGLKDGGMKTESVLARSQNLILGGAYQTRTGETVKSPWVGADGETAKLSEKDVVRIVIQHGVTVFLVAAMVFVISAFVS